MTTSSRSWKLSISRISGVAASWNPVCQGTGWPACAAPPASGAANPARRTDTRLLTGMETDPLPPELEPRDRYTPPPAKTSRARDRADAFGNFAAARRHRCRRAGARAAAVFSPPPWKEGGAQTVRTGLSGIVVVGRRGGLPPPSLLPPGRGEERRARGEERRRRRSASWSGVGAVRASSRLRSFPLEGGRPGGGLTQAPQTGRGSLPTALAPPPPRPLSSPLPGGRREEKGGGEKAAAVRLPVRRRGRSRVLPLSLLPPGRGEGRRQCG